MPAAHPSPHRFLAPVAASTSSAAQQQQQQQQHTAKPKSNLRHALNLSAQPTPAATTTNTSTTQFPPAKPQAPGKRFLIAPGQRNGVGTAAIARGNGLSTGMNTTLPTPRAPDRVEDCSSSAETQTDTHLAREGRTSHVKVRARVRGKLARVESIEETSQSSPPVGPTGFEEEEEEEEEAGPDVVQSVEHHEAMFGSAAEEEVTEDEDEDMEEEYGAAPISHQLSPHDENEEDEDDQETDLLFTPPPKRRRVSTPTPSTPAATTTTTITTTTLATAQKPPHRFRIPAPHTTPARPPNPLNNNPSLPTTTPNSTASKKRPSAAFLLPPHPSTPHSASPYSPNPANPLDPSLNLPEIFSPSRRTGRFLPGGLAQTVQGWLVEAAATAATSTSTTREREREREKGVRLRVRITGFLHSHSHSHPHSHAAQQQQQEEEIQQQVSIYPGTHLLATATTEPGLYNTSRIAQSLPSLAHAVAGEDFGIRVLLAGQGGGGGRGRGAVGTKVKVGDVVGIRAPLWDVSVRGKKWVVGVEWVVL